MSHLKLHLFGPPRLERNGELIDIGRRKALALLAYLAVTGQPHSRDALAALFWPDYDATSARTDLRRMLAVLNKTLGHGWLAVDHTTVKLRCEADLWLDVTEFRRRLAVCQTNGHSSNIVCPTHLPTLNAAVMLYCDHFLAGFTLADSPSFDEWQWFEGESLRQTLTTALEQLVQGYSDLGEIEPAIRYARRWLTLDPLHEPAHRALMQLYARLGHRSAALRQYERCIRLLANELDTPPQAETTALYEQIRVGRLDQAAAALVAPTPVA